ncbi:hypothetical protein BGX31_008803 [Mortierella sp. GBA43]|nr:hypothetical protein BGX31_008803 [Mortierella sp. GBA43]
MMQPISAPILVPGSQHEPTVPPVPLDKHANTSDASSSSSGSGHNIPLGPTRHSMSGGASYHHYKGNNNTNQYHHYNTHNPGSGLRRFTSIGNNKKLMAENTTLQAKVVELERYLTGLKEELILAHRQVHAQRQDLKAAEERKVDEVNELKDHIQKCEFELGCKILECEDLKARLGQDKQQEPSTEEDASNVQKEEEKEDDVVNKALREENARKDVQIAELLEKVDRLGTEVLSLEREKARLERPLTPLSEDTSNEVIATAVGAKAASATLKDLIPITAEAIIAATTPHSLVRNLAMQSGGESGSTSVSHTCLNAICSSPDTAQGEQVLFQNGSNTTATVNSVNYDLAQEHSKLLTKYQALRVQHAQSSVYVEELENEIRELKVQSLDVGATSDPVAH